MSVATDNRLPDHMNTVGLFCAHFLHRHDINSERTAIPFVADHVSWNLQLTRNCQGNAKAAKSKIQKRR